DYRRLAESVTFALLLLMAAAYLTPNAQLQLEAAAGAVAAYGFAEGTGTTTADASGNSLNGSLVGATWTNGRNGSGLLFNGASYVNLGNPTALRLTGSLTVSAWVFEAANVVDDGVIVSKAIESGGWELKSSPDTGVRTFAIALFGPSGAYAGR